jgi:PAT family beta-lactamase induction signal transducer AmpG
MAGAQADPQANSPFDPLAGEPADPAVGLAAGSGAELVAEPAPGSGTAPSCRDPLFSLATPSSVAPWRRLLAVGAEGVASGTPYMVGSKLLQGWLTASGIPLGMIGLLSLAELPYTLKLFWAPLLDRWPIPWPDRRRGWLLVLQLALVAVIAGMALLRPQAERSHLTLVGIMVILLAVVSASQDVMVDAYRTDLLPESERGAGAAAGALGYRTAMLAVGGGGFLLAGWLGWPAAFLGSAMLVAAVLPLTLWAPRLEPLAHPPRSLREAIVGPAREFLRRTGGRRALLLLALVMLYRWPDGLLNLMAVPFMLQAGFSAAQIGAINGGWGIAATMAGTAVGGLLFKPLGLNRSLWVFGAISSLTNLTYWALAKFGGGLAGLMLTVSVEHFAHGMVTAAFLALLMSLCNPRFSATQYALFSGVYALSRSVLAAPAGFLAESLGWSSFFALTLVAAVPTFLLLAVLAPWRENLPRGAYEPLRDPT